MILAENWPEQFGVLDWGYTENLAPISLERFNHWVEQGHHRPLGYLADHRQKARAQLTHIFPEVQSVLVFAFGYHQRKKQDLQSIQKISSYVTGFDGEDYHQVIPRKLKAIGELIQSQTGARFEIANDTKPVLERDFAHQAGLGWIGKNSMLINRTHGSYFILGLLLLDRKLELNASKLETDHCGNCRACIDACPTQAIMDDTRTLIAERCISTYTIELFKDAHAPQGYQNTDYIFGCDICQDVCPWNKKSLKGIELGQMQSTPLDQKLRRPDLVQWLEQISNREFRKNFQATPLERTGRVGLLKNLLRKTTN